MSYFFYICFVISLVVGIISIFKWNSCQCTTIALVTMLSIVVSGGEFFLVFSNEYWEAIAGNRILYFGSCLLAAFLIFNVCNLCKVKMSSLVRIGILFYCIFVFALSCTAGYYDVFYKKVSFTKVNGIARLVKEYGWAHNFYIILLVGGYASVLCVLIYTLLKKKNVSKVNTWIQLVGILVTISTYFISRIVKFDFYIAGIVITQISMFILLARLALYDLDNSVIKVLSEKGNVGVASFSMNRNFLGCNAKAVEAYPVLGTLSIDDIIWERTPEVRELCKWIEELKRNPKAQFSLGGANNLYDVSAQMLTINGKNVGYTFVFRDISNDHESEYKLKKLATTDEMTGLYNRMSFENEINRITENGDLTGLNIVSVDLNCLKSANDTYGHKAGDELIISTAECMKRSFEAYGMIFRVGGDEFIGLLHGPREEIREAVERFENDCKEFKGVYNSGLSVAIGHLAADEYNIKPSLEVLLKVADKRMYNDKEAFYKESGLERRH